MSTNTYTATTTEAVPVHITPMLHDNSGNDIWAIRKNDNEKCIYFS
jgi:hypothetical protein